MNQCELFPLVDESQPQNSTVSHEVWRTIPGDWQYEYEASSFGRFRRWSRGRITMLRGSKNHNGYIHIGLSRSGPQPRQRFYLAHRLIGLVFLAKPDTAKYLVINHKDRNRHNNAVDNLEWVTVSANTKHWRRH